MKRVGILLCALCLTVLCRAEGSESLQNVSSDVYGTSSTHSFTGDNGMTWNTKGAIDCTTGGFRTLTVLATVSGNGITGQLNSTQVEEGVGEISFYVKGMKSGTGYGDRTFRVTAGDVTDDVTINIPSMTSSYKVTATIKRRNISSFTITALPAVSGETATFGMYNFTWTSYDGKTDKPVMKVNDTAIEYGVENGDTVYYAPTNVAVDVTSTTAGATIYYTTDGSTPTTSSASGSTILLPAGGTYTVRTIAWTAALGASDVTSLVVKTGKGRVVQNPCASTTFWPENSGLSSSTRTYSAKSGNPVYGFSATAQAVTPAVVGPKHFSFYAASGSKILTASYQVGTYEVEGGQETWVGGEWTTMGTYSQANGALVSGQMTRIEVPMPAALDGQVAKFKITSSGGLTYVDDINYIYSDLDQVATPTISLASGEVANGQTVSIAAAAGTTIYYTINGGAAQIYSSPIAITGPTVLRAYAEKNDMARSWVAKATYTVANVQPTLATPVFNIAQGEVNWGTQLTITAEAFATLHYTINGGAEQTTTGNVTLTLTEDVAISAYATCSGYTTSATASANYTVVYPVLDSPTFSLESGSVMVGTQLTITVPTGATVVYTINGGPNQISLNSATVQINADMTIVAYARRDGYTNSTSVSRTFTVTYPKLDAPTFSVPAGEVAQGTQVEIRGQKGDTLYYTTDGTSWTRALGMATATISQACTISAYVCRAGYENSDTISASYTLSAIQIEAPFFSIDEGTYAKGTRFALSAVEGATIHYTINENPEQTAVTEVILTLTENMEISAYATKDGYVQSETIQAAFYVKEVIPTAMDEIVNSSSVQKVLRDGQILILRNGQSYDMRGNRVE